MTIVATSVYGSYLDPSDNPIPNVPVVATLIGPTLVSSGSVTREVRTYTDTNGNWQMYLLNNMAFNADPTISFYILKIGNKETYTIVVPPVVYNNGIPVSQSFLTLIGNYTPAISISTLAGNLTIEGDLTIQGSVTVTGKISYGAISVEQQIAPGQVPLFFNDLYVIGDLTVTGTLTYIG